MYVDNSNLYVNQINTFESYITTDKYSHERPYSWPPDSTRNYEAVTNYIEYIKTYENFNKNCNIEEQIDFSSETKHDFDDTPITVFELKNKIADINIVAVKSYTIKETFKADSILEHKVISSVVKRFLTEVYSLIKLKNEANVVKILGCFSVGDQYNIVMECADTDLEEYTDFIKRQQTPFLSINNISYIFREFLLAAQACNKNKIFHGDIKLSNLLVFFDTRKIKLCDFEYKIGIIDNIEIVQCFIYLLQTICYKNYYVYNKSLYQVLTDYEATHSISLPLKYNFLNDSYSIKFFKKLFSFLGQGDKLKNIIIELDMSIEYFNKFDHKGNFNYLELGKFIKLLEQKCNPQPFPIE